MKEHGLILTKGNRLASVEGRQTQIHRVIRPQPKYRAYLQEEAFHIPNFGYIAASNVTALKVHMKAPYQVGDLLYMKEPCQILGEYSFKRNFRVLFLDDGREHRGELTLPAFRKWRARKYPYRATSARFMYKSLARYWFKVTKVRVKNKEGLWEWVYDYEKTQNEGT